MNCAGWQSCFVVYMLVTSLFSTITNVAGSAKPNVTRGNDLVYRVREKNVMNSKNTRKAIEIVKETVLFIFKTIPFCERYHMRFFDQYNPAFMNLISMIL